MNIVTSEADSMTSVAKIKIGIQTLKDLRPESQIAEKRRVLFVAPILELFKCTESTYMHFLRKHCHLSAAHSSGEVCRLIA